MRQGKLVGVARFRYTVIADGIPDDTEDTFTHEHEYGVGDVVWLAQHKFVVERVENTGATNFDERRATTLIEKHLHCRPD